MDHHFVQSNPASRPTWNTGVLNGQPAARFTRSANAGAGQYLLMNTNVQDIWAVDVDTTAYYAIVARYTDAAINNHYLLSMHEADQAALCFTLYIKGGPPPTLLAYAYRNTSNSAAEITVSTPAVNTWFFAEFWKRANDVRGFLNGVQVASASDARSALIRTQNQVAPIYLGSRPATGTAMTGDIAEVLIAKAVPNAEDLASYYAYIGSSYGLTLGSSATSYSAGVATSQGDAQQTVSNGTCNITNSTCVMSGNTVYLGLRFINCNIPRGATITSASIQFTSAGTAQSTALTLAINGEAADDAAFYAATANNLSSRTLTTASVSWAVPTFANSGDRGANQLTPDLSSIIQEIVNRPGWTPGNRLAFQLRQSSGTGARTFAMQDHISLQEATLSVTWA